MKERKIRINFLIALFLMCAVLLSCSKLKELTSEKDKTTKEETIKEPTKETTKDEDRKESGTSSTTTKTTENRLYFCEDYLQGEEVNVSTTFTTGRLTVMVKTTETIYDESVYLKLEKLNDDGTKTTVKTIPFTVPVGDYFYFKHKDLGFSRAGLYKVTMLRKDKSTPIATGEVVVTDSK